MLNSEHDNVHADSCNRDPVWSRTKIKKALKSYENRLSVCTSRCLCYDVELFDRTSRGSTISSKELISRDTMDITSAIKTPAVLR